MYAAGRRAPDYVVFGEPGDLVVLGAHSIEGLNFRVEPVTKQLVDAGPLPAAAVGTSGYGVVRTPSTVPSAFDAVSSLPVR